MTKQQYICRQGWLVMWPLIPVAVVVFSFHVYARIHDVGTRGFWIAFDAAVCCLYILFLARLRHNVRCPDCGERAIPLWRSRPLGRCPECGSDWSAEMAET